MLAATETHLGALSLGSSDQTLWVLRMVAVLSSPREEARVEIIWHRSKVLASGKFNGNDLDVEVTSNARFFFIVLPPVFPRVLSDIILT